MRRLRRKYSSNRVSSSKNKRASLNEHPPLEIIEFERFKCGTREKTIPSVKFKTARKKTVNPVNPCQPNQMPKPPKKQILAYDENNPDKQAKRLCFDQTSLAKNTLTVPIVSEILEDVRDEAPTLGKTSENISHTPSSTFNDNGMKDFLARESIKESENMPIQKSDQFLKRIKDRSALATKIPVPSMKAASSVQTAQSEVGSLNASSLKISSLSETKTQSALSLLQNKKTDIINNQAEETNKSIYLSDEASKSISGANKLKCPAGDNDKLVPSSTNVNSQGVNNDRSLERLGPLQEENSSEPFLQPSEQPNLESKSDKPFTPTCNDPVKFVKAPRGRHSLPAQILRPTVSMVQPKPISQTKRHSQNEKEGKSVGHIENETSPNLQMSSNVNLNERTKNENTIKETKILSRKTHDQNVHAKDHSEKSAYFPENLATTSPRTPRISSCFFNQSPTSKSKASKLTPLSRQKRALYTQVTEPVAFGDLNSEPDLPLEAPKSLNDSGLDVTSVTRTTSSLLSLLTDSVDCKPPVLHRIYLPSSNLALSPIKKLSERKEIENSLFKDEPIQENAISVQSQLECTSRASTNISSYEPVRQQVDTSPVSKAYLGINESSEAVERLRPFINSSSSSALVLTPSLVHEPEVSRAASEKEHESNEAGHETIEIQKVPLDCSFKKNGPTLEKLLPLEVEHFLEVDSEDPGDSDFDVFINVQKDHLDFEIRARCPSPCNFVYNRVEKKEYCTSSC